MIDTYLFALVFVPLLFAFVPLAIERYVTTRYLGLACTFFPLFSVSCIVKMCNQIGWTTTTSALLPFIPTLGINISLFVDGLSLFFGLLVSCMGVLVFFYSHFYLDSHYEHRGRFYSYLTFFMGSMLGCVFSDNLLILFIFWELTGLASFLLIGFTFKEQGSRMGARMSYLVTALTGLFLLVGIVMIGIMSGTYTWGEIASQGLPLKENATYCNVALLFCMIGIFGKSAQFPFHFWLPNAMSAPSPVSSYLHSATMVKLGVFLTARLYPIFVESELWFPLTATVCFSTMFLGAMLSLLSNDLKAILAFATVSQLGFFIGFYGLGDSNGVEYDFVHILNHAFYKASLFMLVGIVDKATGIRDIRRLGGLVTSMPLTAFAFFLSAAAMAGMPGSTGFLSKELMIANLMVIGEAKESTHIIMVVVAFASVFKIAFSIRLFYHIFIRKPVRKVTPKKDPGVWIHVSPLILCTLALYFGIQPHGLERLTETFFVSGLHSGAPHELAVWHGFTATLLISVSIMALGGLLFYMAESCDWMFTHIPKLLRFDLYYQGAVLTFMKACRKITMIFHATLPSKMIALIVTAFLVLVGGKLLLQHKDITHLILSGLSTRPLNPFAMLTVVGMIAATGGVLMIRRRPSQLIALAVTGFLVTFYYVIYQAPDIALTQLLVEAVSFLLMVLMLAVLPYNQPKIQIPPLALAFRWILATLTGVLLTTLMLLATSQPAPERLGSFFLNNTEQFAKGKNAVNTILVDFRGFDTMGEITVLLIAALGCLALLVRSSQSPLLIAKLISETHLLAPKKRQGKKV